MERNPTILIVDDDPQIRRLQRLVLERAGYHVIQAASGEEALEAAHQERPDLILLDVVLPDIEGPDVCRRIKADADLAGTHVVLISGKRTEPDDQVEGLKSGADGSIMRPIAPRELLARVEAHLRTQEVERQLRSAEARYRAVFKTAPVGIYRAAPDWDVVMANPALGRMLGYEEADALNGKNLDADVRGPDYPRAAFEQQMADDDEVTSLEAVWTRRDGEPIFVLESVRPIRDDAGRLAAYQGTVQDVTRRVVRRRRARRRQAVLSAGRHINQLIARQEDPSHLVATACEHLAAVDGYDTVWIGLRADDQQPAQTVSAGRPSPPPSILQLPGRTPSDAPHKGAGAREHAWILEEPEMSQTAEACSPRSLIAARLRHGGGTYGLLVVSTPPDLNVDEVERALLQEVAGDVALALHDFEHQKLHRRADRALQQSERRYRLLAETTRDIIVTHDLEGNITYANQSAVDFLGYTREELLSMSVADVLPPHERAAVEERARRRADGNHLPNLYQTDVVDASGKRKPLEVSSAPIRRGGQNEEILLAARDLTERRRAQEALRESEERYRTLFESSIDGIAQSDLAGNIVDCNQAYLDLTGHTLEEIRRLSYQDLTPQEWADVDAAAIKQALERGYSDLYEKERIRKDGTVFPVSIRMWARRDENGEPIAMWGIVRDVSQRKEAEAEAALKEERLQSLFDITQYAAQDIQDLLDYALSQAVELTDSDVGYIYHYHEDRQQFVLNTWSDEVMDECRVAERETVYDLEKTGIWGEAVRQRRRILINDFQAPHPLKKGYPEGHVELENFLTVPIFSGDSIAAVVGVGNKPTDYDDSDARELTLLMDSVWKVVEQRRAEEALRESEERYRSVFEEIPAGLYRTRPDGEVIDANPALVEMLHYPDQESFLGINARDLYARPEERATRFDEIGPDGGWNRVTLELRRGYGEVIWVADTGRTVTDAEGNILYYSGVLEDVTAFKEAQEALRESEARNRAILDALPDLMFVVREDGVFLDYYATSGSGLYLPGEAFLGRRIQDVFPPGTGDRLQSLIARAVRTQEMQIGEYNLCMDGHVRYFEARIVPHREDATLSVIREITDRRRAEEALRQSQERMDLALHGADLGTWDWDVEGEEIVCDARWAEMLGFSLEEVHQLDNPWRALSHPDDCPAVIQAFNNLRQGKAEPLEIELRMRHRAGRWVWVLCKGRVTQRDADGETLRMSGTHVDITERKHAEEQTARLLEHQIAVNDLALALSETRDLDALYRAVYDHVGRIADAWGFVVSSYDPDAQQIRADYAVFKGSEIDAAGFPPLALAEPGRGTQSRVIHTGAPFYAPDYRKAVATSTREYSYEPDGSMRQGPPPEEDDDVTRSALYVPMKLEGETVGVMQLHSSRPAAYSEQDKDTLTTIANLAAVAGQNARLLERTRQQARRLQQTIESVPEGVLLLDEDHRVILCNPVAQADLDVLAAATVGDVLHQLGGVPLEELLAPPASDRAWHQVEFEGRTFEIIGRPMTSRAQQERWVLVINDVTREKEVEEQLHQQERLAAIGQLAGGIAHDFNNILASIILYAQMHLGSDDVSPDLDEALRTILEESHRAADLVQQILDFSRRAMMETKILNLSSMVQDTASLLRRTLPESIRLSTALVSGPVVVDADPTRIHQVLMNLALNAKDAMPDGGRLRISIDRITVDEGVSPPAADMAPGAWAALSVSDTGTGISEEAQEHLFEPFFTTKGPDRGTGLGLAQVYGIVKQHKGAVDVETEKDQGTTFTIYLPLAEPEGGEPPADEEVVPLPGQGETILVVEDAPQLRGALQVGLESMGYRVIPASHGRQALEILSAREVDLVLTDVVMPEMGGKALLNHLRAERPALKIIAMTGHVVDTGVQGLRDAGFSDALPKPFSIEELTQIVRDVLDR